MCAGQPQTNSGIRKSCLILQFWSCDHEPPSWSHKLKITSHYYHVIVIYITYLQRDAPFNLLHVCTLEYIEMPLLRPPQALLIAQCTCDNGHPLLGVHPKIKCFQSQIYAWGIVQYWVHNRASTCPRSLGAGHLYYIGLLRAHCTWTIQVLSIIIYIHILTLDLEVWCHYFKPKSYLIFDPHLPHSGIWVSQNFHAGLLLGHGRGS